MGGVEWVGLSGWVEWVGLSGWVSGCVGAREGVGRTRANISY